MLARLWHAFLQGVFSIFHLRQLTLCGLPFSLSHSDNRYSLFMYIAFSGLTWCHIRTNAGANGRCLCGTYTWATYLIKQTSLEKRVGFFESCAQYNQRTKCLF